MKKCYFLGLDEIYDLDLMGRVNEELEQLVQKEDQIEFWFFSVVHPFEFSCFYLAIGMRSKYPDKDIKIVKVYDPVRSDNPDSWFEAVYDRHLPWNLLDRIDLAPVMDEGFGQIPSQAVNQLNKVERWVIRQMDVVIAYNYPRLENSVSSMIKHAQVSSNADIISISFEETERIIQEQFDAMPEERTSTIFKLRQDGVSNKEIGKVLGISSTRVSQLTDRATREIRRTLKARISQQIKKEKPHHICGLVGLSNDGSALQLAVFDSLLHHLVEYCGVTEFWLDEQTAKSGFGSRVALFCARGARTLGLSERPEAKVVVCLPVEDEGMWAQSIKKHVPPYRAVVNLGIDQPEDADIYQEMIRQCKFFITDFSTPKAQLIRDLCGKNGDTYLLDASKDKLKIAEQYI